MSENIGKKKKAEMAASREARLKSALRANLRRRKAAARKSDDVEETGDDTALPQSSDTSPE